MNKKVVETHEKNKCVIDMQTGKKDQVELLEVFLFFANITMRRAKGAIDFSAVLIKWPQALMIRHRLFCLLTNQLVSHLRFLLSLSFQENMNSSEQLFAQSVLHFSFWKLVKPNSLWVLMTEHSIKIESIDRKDKLLDENDKEEA